MPCWYLGVGAQHGGRTGRRKHMEESPANHLQACLSQPIPVKATDAHPMNMVSKYHANVGCHGARPAGRKALGLFSAAHMPKPETLPDARW